MVTIDTKVSNIFIRGVVCYPMHKTNIFTHFMQIFLLDFETVPTVWYFLFFILFFPISDRPGVGESFHLEKMEEDLTLALKCQFLLNHGQCDKLFPKTVEILVDLRSISTMHSEKILNSTIEVDSDD